jgi:hypothetical protein
MAREKFYPTEKDLGKDCIFWQSIDTESEKHVGVVAVGCFFPKAEMEGRLSCEGIIDDVCLYLKDGRIPKSLTEEQLSELQRRIPITDNREIPPGDIIR